MTQEDRRDARMSDIEAQLESIRPRAPRIDIDAIIESCSSPHAAQPISTTQHRVRSLWLLSLGGGLVGAAMGACIVFVMMQGQIARLQGEIAAIEKRDASTKNRPGDVVASKRSVTELGSTERRSTGEANERLNDATPMAIPLPANPLTRLDLDVGRLMVGSHRFVAASALPSRPKPRAAEDERRDDNDGRSASPTRRLGTQPSTRANLLKLLRDA